MRYFLAIIFFYCSLLVSGQTTTGSIKGVLLDADTKAPLIGANVTVLNTNLGAATNENGEFLIPNVPTGSYSVRFGYIGYKSIVKTDIIVKPARTNFIEAALNPEVFETESVVVTSGYFENSQIQPNSLTSFSYEEIRRAPGSAGDVSRIVMGLPSIGKVGDQSNSLIVRGGSSIENSFYVDNIEIPNINHFPMVGTSGGPIGVLNVDFIKNVDFYSGGFGAKYGDKLSSVMNIELREGSHDEFNAQLDMSFQGLGGIVEGPLAGGKGSWLFTVRRSYLDVIFDKVASGEAMPTYYDSQAKVVYNLSQNHKLSVVNVFSNDNQKMEYKKAFDNEKNHYGDIDIISNSAGINWQYIWEKSGYSEFTLSHHLLEDKRDMLSTISKQMDYKSRTIERAVRFRNTNHIVFSKEHKLNLGLDVKFLHNNYDNFYSQNENKLGVLTPEIKVKTSLEAMDFALFFNHNLITGNFDFNLGVRASYNDLNSKMHAEPRFSVTYHFNDLTSVTGLYGIYHQNNPHVLISQNDSFKRLEQPRAHHYVLSFSHLLTQDTKLTVEFYNKDYFNLPMNPETPQLMVFDDSFFNSYLEANVELLAEGKAYARGVEVSVQKKLVENIYGLIAGSYYRARYKTLDGKWLDRLYDNKFNFTIEGGYKPNNLWEFSMRWIYAGGTPYTPFNLAASRAANEGIYQADNIHGERLPDYHSLNLRVDRRFNFGSSSLIAYISVWNAYGRKNLAGYSWNQIKNDQQEEKQWSLLPIFGIEFEF
jgi:hypothetical protein